MNNKPSIISYDATSYRMPKKEDEAFRNKTKEYQKKYYEENFKEKLKEFRKNEKMKKSK